MKTKQNKNNNKQHKLCMFYEKKTLARMRYNINVILKWDRKPPNKQTLMLQKEKNRFTRIEAFKVEKQPKHKE